MDNLKNTEKTACPERECGDVREMPRGRRRCLRLTALLIAVFLAFGAGAAFAESRLIDVGLWYGKLSPTWVELVSAAPFRVVVTKHAAGDIGATKAVGLDGSRAERFALTDVEGNAVYKVSMKPFQGTVVVTERFSQMEESEIRARMEDYRQRGIEVMLYYDSAPALAVTGFEDDAAAWSFVSDRGLTGEVLYVQDCFSVSDANGRMLALLSASNKDCMVAADVCDMSCSQSEKTYAYRGGFRYTLGSSGSFALVNRVDIEEYLYGVVPVEMSASWPMESLKAQAVAARNYAVVPSGKYARYGFDVDDSTGSQAYYGYGYEKSRATQAVDETRGEYMLYDNEVIHMFFNASSGGYLDSVGNIWGGKDLPYLYPKPDPYSFGYTWQYTLYPWFLTEVIREMGEDVGEPSGIEILERTESGRVKKMKIIGLNGSFEVSGERFKAVVNSTKFKSTLFTFDPDLAQRFVEKVDGDTGSQGGESSGQVRKLSEIVGRAVSPEGRSVTKAEIEAAHAGSASGSESGNTDAAGNSGSADAEHARYRLLFADSETAYFNEGVITIYGHGYGHGIGLSQIGAVKMAELGKSYLEILMFYYNKVESLKR